MCGGSLRPLAVRASMTVICTFFTLRYVHLTITFHVYRLCRRHVEKYQGFVGVPNLAEEESALFLQSNDVVLKRYQLRSQLVVFA